MYKMCVYLSRQLTTSYLGNFRCFKWILLLFISVRDPTADGNGYYLSCGSKTNINCYTFVLFAFKGNHEVTTLWWSTDTDCDDAVVCRDVNFSLVTKLYEWPCRMWVLSHFNSGVRSNELETHFFLFSFLNKIGHRNWAVNHANLMSCEVQN